MQAAGPVPVIFDTDMGNDIDDALALAMLHGLETKGEARLLAVTVSKSHPDAARFVDAVNRFYGRGEVPVGLVRKGATPETSAYLQQPLARRDAGGRPLYPHRPATAYPDATELLEATLRKAADGTVVVIQVGFSTNTARLLRRPGGRELVARKVRLLSIMAGQFQKEEAEYNVKEDVASARTVFAEWPGQIVVSPFELGDRLLFPGAAMVQHFQQPANHPIADAYRAFQKFPYDRPTWDLTSALYAVRPDSGFRIAHQGRVEVTPEGVTHLRPQANGPHLVLTLPSAAEASVISSFVALSALPPPAAKAGKAVR